MHSMKDALMKYETIDAGQIDDLMERKSEIRQPAGWGDQAKSQQENAEEASKVSEPVEEKKEESKAEDNSEDSSAEKKDSE